MKIPVATRRTNPSSQPLAYLAPQGATPEAFGAGVSRSLIGLAGEVKSLYDDMEAQRKQTERFNALKRFSDFQLQVAEHVTEMKRELDPNDATFFQRVNDWYGDQERAFLANQVPPELQDEFSVRTADLKLNTQADALKFQQDTLDKYYSDTILEQYDHSKVAVDQKSDRLDAEKKRVGEIIANSGLPEAAKQDLYKTVVMGLEAVAYKSAVRAGLVNPEAIGVGPDAVDTDPRFADIPYEDRLNIRADAEREQQSARNDQAAAEKAQNEAAINSLLVAIHDGAAGQTDIDALRQAGVLTDYEDIQKAEKALDDRDSDIRLRTNALTKLQDPSGVWDPTSADDKKMLNALVGDTGLQAIREGNQEYVDTVVAPLVSHTRDIPTDVVGTLEGMARSNNQDRAMFAYNTLAQLQEQSPDAFAMRVPDSLAKDVEFWRARKDVYTQEELFQMLQGGRTPQERQQREALREEARSKLRDPGQTVKDDQISLSDVVKEFDFGWFTGPNKGDVPWVAGQLETDFRSLFEDEYVRYGNTADAKDAAIKRLKRIWGVTNVGGHILMRYPPEQVGYQPIGGSYDWINQQVREELSIPDDERFQLVSDDQTRDEFLNWQHTPNGEPPSYQVVRWKAGNVPELVMRSVGDPEHRTETNEPYRIYFEKSADLQRLEELNYGMKQLDLEYRDFYARYSQAKTHSVMTGLPIPAELEAEKKALDAKYNEARDALREYQAKQPERKIRSKGTITGTQ